MHRATAFEMDDEEQNIVDFRNASLYLPGLQILVAVLACSLTSVLACWLLPAHAVSAVRTLTLAIIVGGLCVRKPLRLGRVHGLALVFSALRPAVAVYLGCLVVEQLTHGCASSPEVTPSWRRVVFQAAICAMILSGFLRARKPLARTDVPFLITTAAILVVAALPPPAVALAGPLCEPVSAFGAAERLVRALCFSSCYTVFVYTSAPPTATTGDILVCLTRASAASVWTLGATLPLLVLSLPQCAMVIWSRLKDDTEDMLPVTSVHAMMAYGALPTRSPAQERSQSPVYQQPSQHNQQAQGALHEPSAPSPTPSMSGTGHCGGGAMATTSPNLAGSAASGPSLAVACSCPERTFGVLPFREVGGGGCDSGLVGGGTSAGGVPMTRERMAAIAAELEDGA